MNSYQDHEQFLQSLRSNHLLLDYLPNHIQCARNGELRDEQNLPLIKAKVDDIAFAQCRLSEQLTQLVSTVESLKKLHDLARRHGAKGVDVAIEYLAARQEQLTGDRDLLR